MTKTPPVDAFAQARPIDLPFLLLNALFLAPLLLNSMFLAPLLLSPLLDIRPVAVDLGFRAFVVPADALTYAATFPVSNVVTEVYGHRRANRVVLAGLFACICALGVVWLCESLPGAEGSHAIATNARSALFWFVQPLVAYVAAQYVAVWSFHLLRRATSGRLLWLRCCVSTMAAQLVSVLLLSWTPWVSPWPTRNIGAMAMEQWYLLSLLAFALTPFCYAAVLVLQRWRARPL